MDTYIYVQCINIYALHIIMRVFILIIKKYANCMFLNLFLDYKIELRMINFTNVFLFEVLHLNLM